MTVQEKIVSRASAHPIVYDRPAPDFFEGALLGNGALGVVVTTRPDAVVLHFGHNNVWDIRIKEHEWEALGTFQEIYEKLAEIAERGEDPRNSEWFQAYTKFTEEPYSERFPCPMPCGSVLLGFDRKQTEVLGHCVDIARGVCEVKFLHYGERYTLEAFVEPDRDRLWICLRDSAGDATASIFDRIKLIPDPVRKKDLPAAEVSIEEETHRLSYVQRLPYHLDIDARSPRDKGFQLTAKLAPSLSLTPRRVHFEQAADFTTNEEDRLMNAGQPVGADILGDQPLLLYVQLHEGLYDEGSRWTDEEPLPDRTAYERAYALQLTEMEDYWSRSSISLGDEFLEQIWYWNLYFFRCAVSPRAACPGLFGNWSYKEIGTSWHGDYHMNYNTQQPFWLPFSSNHVELHMAYVNLVHHLLPVSRAWAERYYGMRGAFFPHSAYPIEMSIMPYPVPSWGWEVCETPWTVQSLWWHYLYTHDLVYLEEEAFEPIRDAVLFMVDYMTRPDAHGEQWNDDKYHIFPTVAPELYGMTSGFRLNKDCLVDLTLTKFMFGAYLESCRLLGRVDEEAETVALVQKILERFPEYPTAELEDGRQVYTCVEGETPDVVYNTPNSLMHVFPGEERGLHSPPEEYEKLRDTYLHHYNEGGNELVFYHLQGARLGLLDLERFKRHIRYCMMPNGTCTDRVLQTGGRYSDTQPFDFMSRMGVWVENFSLPAVINECLLQSYNGVLRLFPNWPEDQYAEFHTLRAVGGFLVSAKWEQGQVQHVEIHSEAGGELRMINPWAGAVICEQAGVTCTMHGEMLILSTRKEETFRLTPGPSV